MKKSVNAIRLLSMDQINKANSGHPGVVLGFAPVAYTLFHDVLRITKDNPTWFNRDRFVLASGHASSMLYSLLHLSGYNISIQDLKKFRQLNSKTPGHPEYKHTDGIDSTSGPLGQGIAIACGMAIAEENLRNRFNRDDYNIIDHYTFVECGDGDLQEGVTLEALSLIGHLKLNKLIILFDSNKIQLDGPVSNAGGIPNSKQYFKSLGFNYLEVKNPENLNSVKKAIESAKLSPLPSVIEFHTTIGYKSPLEGSNKSHGNPLKEEYTNILKDNLDYHYNSFKVPKSVYNDFNKTIELNSIKYKEWCSMLEGYKAKYPNLYIELEKVMNNDYSIDLSLFDNFDFKDEASRQTIGKALEVIYSNNKVLMSGSADLCSSTYVKGPDGDFTPSNRLGRNINYGVREHAMGAITNGLVLSNVRAISGAFFVFSDYMKPAIRLSALMNIPSLFIFTHDSIAVGEDGPTHEPIEQIAGLRSIPNLTLFRPSDSYTTVLSLKKALELDGPSVMVLTRQKLPYLGIVSMDDFNNGAWIRKDFDKIDGVLVASGSEVNLALEASKLLEKDGKNVRVVEVCSTNLYDKTSKEFKEKLVPNHLPSMFVEMQTSYGLKGYAKETFALDRFGLSAPCDTAIKYLGFTKENVYEAFKKIV